MDSNDRTFRPRRSTRLKGFDYSQAGIYFVTICSAMKRPTFGSIAGKLCKLSKLGDLVATCWLRIPDHFPRIELGEFVVMPNHLHGLVVFHRGVGAQHVAPLRHPHAPSIDAQPHITTLAPKADTRHLFVQPSSLGAVVRAFKATVTRRAKTELEIHSRIWQRNYFERVVRRGKEFELIQRYILENPMRWDSGRENPTRTTRDE
jgi:putative transposase